MTQKTFDIDLIVEKLLIARKAYYRTGHPVMTDQEYDALENLVRQVDPTHPILHKVGEEPSSLWKKARHEIFMGSLAKVNTEDEFRDWAAKTSGRLTLQPKLDGLSLSMVYEDGKFVRAITRGKGITGEDISPNVSKMAEFVDKTSEEFTGSVRCEIILLKKDLDRINSVLDENDRYKNCRNAAAGISRRLDGKYCAYLHLIFYDISLGLGEEEKILSLRNLGFKTVPYSTGTIDQIINAHEELEEKRESLPYNIDGSVIKINDHETQVSMGIVSGRPKGQIAWKFDPPSAATVLLNVEAEIGRTGVITPVAILEPVEIDGSTIQRATLHNIAEIERLGVGIGDIVMVVKRNDIIPKIESVIEHKGVPIDLPDACPACGSPVESDGIRLTCSAEECPGKSFHRIMNFIKVAKIDSLGETLVEKLYDIGKLRSIADLYRLRLEDIAGLERWGLKSAQTIIDNINKVRTLDQVTFLAGMGIPTLSVKTAEELLGQFGTIESLQGATMEQIAGLRGFSDISAEKIVTGLQAFKEQIQETMELVTVTIAEKELGSLSGKSFCFTGTLDKSRTYYQAMVEKNGGKNDKSITKTTSYLVAGENVGQAKTEKAEKYGTEVISQKQFLEMIGDVVEEKPKLKTVSLFED